jgi:predicted transcriptional regulator YdeE
VSLKIEQFGSRLLLGMSRPFISATSPDSNAGEVIGPLWAEMSKLFFSMNLNRDQNPTGVAAIWCDSESDKPGAMIYFAGYEVQEAPIELGGLEVLELQPEKYAYIEHVAPMSDLPATIADFYSNVLPSSGIERKQGIDLEIYYETQDEQAPMRVVIAAPVV